MRLHNSHLKRNSAVRYENAVHLKSPFCLIHFKSSSHNLSISIIYEDKVSTGFPSIK